MLEPTRTHTQTHFFQWLISEHRTYKLLHSACANLIFGVISFLWLWVGGKMLIWSRKNENKMFSHRTSDKNMDKVHWCLKQRKGKHDFQMLLSGKNKIPSFDDIHVLPELRFLVLFCFLCWLWALTDSYLLSSKTNSTPTIIQQPFQYWIDVEM